MKKSVRGTVFAVLFAASLTSGLLPSERADSACYHGAGCDVAASCTEVLGAWLKINVITGGHTEGAQNPEGYQQLGRECADWFSYSNANCTGTIGSQGTVGSRVPDGNHCS